ncbi:MAG: ABC transporter ATP-binding protein [Bacteroidota bacterium]|nr:ABC transporter ATP-binding protein [Bacteroidota bacterium]
MIDVKKLNFSYVRRNSLFSDLQTTFETGKIYGLLGKNGVGKTTLLKLISGLLFPQSGEITIDSLSASKRIPEYLSKIFLLTEEYDLPKLKINKYLDIYSGFYPNFDKQVFDENIKAYELSYDKVLTNMSFGQKKKFLISFALATNVPVLIMDEPTNGMDIPSKTIFRKMVASSLDDNKLIIISTHQVRDVEGLIDYVKIIEDGSIIFDQDYNLIDEKLMATKTEKMPENALFSAEIFGGFLSLIPREEEEKTVRNIDLELLFNAVITNSTEINKYLKK